MATDIRREPLASLIAQHPGWIVVLEEFGIDGRTGTDITLRGAADRAGVDVEAVIAAMSGPPQDRWTCESVHEAPLRGLINHIEGTHHGFLRAEFPRIARMLAAELAAHPGDERLTEIEATFSKLRYEMETHIQTEEAMLFPLCRSIMDAFSWPSFHTGSVTEPIRGFTHDHAHAHEHLDRLVALAGDHPAVDPAIAALDADLRSHLHEEDDLLFPATIRLAEELDQL